MPPTSAPKKSAPTNAAKPAKKRGTPGEDPDLEEYKKAKQLHKPPDQLELCDFELKELYPRVLQTKNLQQPDNLVHFDYASRAFVLLPGTGDVVFLLHQQGTYLHKESDEARKQYIALGIDPAELGAPASDYEPSATTVEDDETVTNVDDEDDEEDDEEEGGGEGKEADEGSRPTPGKKLTNQFNFCERDALTYNLPCRTRDTQTTPLPKATHSDNVLAWIIYDAYKEDFAEQEAERERQRELRERDKMPASKHAPQKKYTGKSQFSEAVQGRIYDCWKTLERMINQNTYNAMAQDYRYWEDPADEFREDEGTLLPLWKFTFDKTRKNTVTDFCWCPHYYDLFAVCYGYFEFMKPVYGGALCLFTIKNPSFPEYICLTDSGVMCVDIHKQYPYMVVIGLYDGNVLVYNVQENCKEPAFASLAIQKHSDIVWEVKWSPNLPDGELNFYSVSGDGKVNHWVLMQNSFAVTTIINLYLDAAPVRGADGTLVKKRGWSASASCLKFNPSDPNIYLVGTEEGLIHKCSVAYSQAYLFTYHAHQMPIYRIDFNKLNSDLFVSCSADWRIKIWEDCRHEPLYVFDLGYTVGDVKWAPYSTTVLGAVTIKGKAYIFDLNINKYKPICVQGIVSRKKFKCTRFSFNHKIPVIICGDDKGCVTTLKLSPNLRIPCKAPKKQQHLDQITLQQMKLDRLLALAREPVIIKRPLDPAGRSEGES